MPDKGGRYLPPPPWDLEPEQVAVRDMWLLLLAREPHRAELGPSVGSHCLQQPSVQR